MKEGTVTQLCQQTNCRTTNLISLHIVLQVVGNWRRWCNGAKQSPALIWNHAEPHLATDAHVCAWSEVQTDSHKYLWIFGRSTLNIATARAEQIRYLLLAETLMDRWSICGDFIWSSRVQTESPLWSKTPPRSKIPTCWIWNLKKMEFQRIWKWVFENSNKVWTTLRPIFNSLWDCERVIIVFQGVASEDIGAKSSYERSPAGWKSDSDIFLKKHIVTNMR